MIKVVNEDYKTDRARWDEILKSVTGDLAISAPYQDFGMGYRMIDIEPTMDSINKIVDNAKSVGFKEVDRYDSKDRLNPSNIVLTREDENGRVVFAVIYDIRSELAYIDCGYAEAEDAEYFE